MKDNIESLLHFVYGNETAADLYARVDKLIDTYRGKVATIPRSTHFFDQRDAVLITYGDMVQADGEAPLATLHRFLNSQISGIINAVHILPFYPYTSDDGFSVVDYRKVNPDLGDWRDIESLKGDFYLMFDAVINHISAQSEWFQGFLTGRAPYDDYFTVVDPSTDLSAVFRPRTLPLLTPFATVDGEKHVWTTFSADQIDLNFANPELLLDVLDVLLGYVQHGARLIRLDAVGFIWKQIGTRCIHLPEAHAIIQLMRAVLDEVAPGVVLVTETNVPHQENISYFGDGHNEAQMVYNFPLPPLTLHAFHSGDATTLSQWAAGLDLPSEQTTFFNFLASHDGIGVTPARGILSEPAIQALANRVEALGGFVSYRQTPDGDVPYELNINYLDALGEPGEQIDDAWRARRLIAAYAIALSLRGVPGIYFHSLFGSRSWLEGVEQTGQKRTVNRQKLTATTLTAELSRSGSLRQQVFDGLQRLLALRAAQPAFHPSGSQQVFNLHSKLFAVMRTTLDGGERVLCLHNISNEPVAVSYPEELAHDCYDLADDGRSPSSPPHTLEPFAIAWLKAVRQ